MHGSCNGLGVSRTAVARLVWILCAACGVWLASAGHGMALTWDWRTYPDRERLEVVFDGPAAGYSLERTGRQALTLTLPPGQTVGADGLRRAGGTAAPGASGLLDAPTGAGRSITIPTRTPAFGYIASPEGGNRLAIDLFSDPIGERWRPAEERSNTGVSPAAPATPVSGVAAATSATAQTVTPRSPNSGASPTSSVVAASPTQPASGTRPASVAENGSAQTPARPAASGAVQASPSSPANRGTPLREAALENVSELSPSIVRRAGGQLPPAPSSAAQTGPVPTQTGSSSAVQAGPQAVSLAERTGGADGATARSVVSSAEGGAGNGTGRVSGSPVPAAPAPKVTAAQSYFAVPYTFRSRVNRGGMDDWQEPAAPAAAPVVRDAPVAGDSLRARVSMPSAPSTGSRNETVPGAAQNADSIVQPVQTAGRTSATASLPSQRAAASRPVSSPGTPAGASDEDREDLPEGSLPEREPGQEFSVRARVSPPGQVTTVRRAPDGAGEEPFPVASGADILRVRPQTGAQANGSLPLLPPAPNNATAMPPAPAGTGSAVPVAGSGADTPGQEERFVVSNSEPAVEPYPTLKESLVGEEPVVVRQPITVPPAQMEAVAGNVPQPAAQSDGTPKPEVVYVDSEGNPIPPPPSPATLLFQAQAAMNNGEPENAIPLFETVWRMPKSSQKERSEALDGIADATYAMGKNDLTANFEKIVSASTEAMNYDLASPSVPGHLLRLGLVNLKAGNLGEAAAYFSILRKNHPNSDLIPLTYYYWGDHFFKAEDWENAADNYQFVIQNYPDSPFVREAGVGLARALYQLGFYEQAFQIVDYVEKRWPRFYMEYPPFLYQMGDVEYRMKKFDKARTTYWTYYNIDPDGDDADMVLARLGDLYLEENKKTPAREVYEEAARKFPDRDGGLISLMRLAEEGVYDSPTLTEMFSVFDRPYNLRPLQIYSMIIEDHPQSGLVPLARLKKAMWYLWNKQYPEALATASAFMKASPDHTLAPRVKEVALKAFTVMVADNINEGNYDRILQMWDQFPIVRGQDEELAPESRIALGLAFWKRQQPTRALETLDPFFRGLKVPEYSEMALNVALSIYLENELWDDIVALNTRLEHWELDPESQRQFSYALALAYENLGEFAKAEPLWTALAANETLPDNERAYALYFLSRAAERREDWESAYRDGKQALTLFMELAQRDPANADPQKEKDLLGSLMDITERTGRGREALDWAKRYLEQMSPTDPGYPGLQYRVGELYKRNGNVDQWREIMTTLRDGTPDSLYGKMAASALRMYDLTEGASRFSPSGQL